MKTALEALEMLAKWEHPASNITTKSGRIYPHHVAKNSAATLRLAIEQAEKQEPVAWLYRDAWGTLKLSEIMPPPVGSFPVYTAPPNRQPLTREQVLECEREADAAYVATRADELRPSWASIFARAIERKHGIGGGE